LIKTILFNGPPNSGKDTFADVFEEANHLRFKDSLYEEASIISGIPLHEVKAYATDRITKELPCPWFLINGKAVSPRKYLIHISENVIKPLLGESYFGIKTASKLQEGLNVISESGFVEEFKPVAKLSDELIVARIHREGCSFEGDSRSYLPESLVTKYGGRIIDIQNKGPLKNMKIAVKEALWI